MTAFPPSPVPPARFVEDLLPGLLGPPALAAATAGLRVRLGLALTGRGGGEWTLVLRSKGLEVESGLEAPLTLALSVKDWRGALWEGRGSVLGALLARGLGAGPEPASISGPLRFDLGVVDKLADLDATLGLTITGGRGGDWQLALRLGEGPVAGDPQLGIRVEAADAEALAARELEPLAAMMTGRIRVDGEMSLLLQIQALLLQARG